MNKLITRSWYYLFLHEIFFFFAIFNLLLLFSFVLQLHFQRKVWKFSQTLFSKHIIRPPCIRCPPSLYTLITTKHSAPSQFPSFMSSLTSSFTQSFNYLFITKIPQRNRPIPPINIFSSNIRMTSSHQIHIKFNMGIFL